MNDPAATRLADRQPPPPAPLGDALARALAGPAPAPAAPELAALAAAALRRALVLGDARAAAYELLVADALLTYAIECAAESGLGALQALLDAWGPGAIAQLGEADA